MVVAGFVTGAPIAHGPGVDDLVVEDVVAVSAADGGLGRVMLAGIAGGRYQLRGRAIDAEIVGGGEVDQILGVNGAVKVVVEVPAFGHVVQKGEQERGLLADGVEVTRGFLLGGLGGGERGEKKNKQNERNGSPHCGHASGAGNAHCSSFIRLTLMDHYVRNS